MEDLIVWTVSDDPDRMLWRTKLDAEKWCRELHPHLDEDARYARIYYKTVYSYEENPK